MDTENWQCPVIGRISHHILMKLLTNTDLLILSPNFQFSNCIVLFLLKSTGLRGPPCLTQMLCLQLECWQETAFKMLSHSRQQEKKSVFYLRLAKNKQKQKQKKHQPKTRLNLVWTVQQYRFLLDYFQCVKWWIFIVLVFKLYACLYINILIYPIFQWRKYET